MSFKKTIVCLAAYGVTAGLWAVSHVLPIVGDGGVL